MPSQKAGHRVERPLRTDESAGVDRSPALSFPFSASRHGELLMMGLPHPSTCVLRLSQPLDALLPPNPPELVIRQRPTLPPYDDTPRNTVCTPEHLSRSSVRTVVSDSLQSSRAVGLLSRGHFHLGSGVLVYHSPKRALRFVTGYSRRWRLFDKTWESRRSTLS